MGSKTALLAFSAGDPRPALRGAARPDPAQVVARVRELHPEYDVTPLGTGSLPYWAGEHPVRSTVTGEPYPLPFHPLELGGGPVLRALFGFAEEGAPAAGDIDPFGVPLLAFRVADPSGRERADRQAAMERLVALMDPPRRYRFAPDGTLRETTDGGS
ncbi:MULTISPECIES: DUF6928 family protein [Catenuloplanes]|uniref:Uncharacterized protein n=1 Tax=Catenuloplanes niger TaxID=587534 RepID=A0AAE3ZXJ7_9ACTN|nr:hypothetical protein [Catenuloplanes niger]MDR7327858.1 hypothetical protein [Catenuloplanes niger]